MDCYKDNMNPWNTLGRQTKLALARRDPHVIRIHLDGLDASIRHAVLALADKYAADALSREVKREDGRRG